MTPAQQDGILQQFKAKTVSMEDEGGSSSSAPHTDFNLKAEAEKRAAEEQAKHAELVHSLLREHMGVDTEQDHDDGAPFPSPTAAGSGTDYHYQSESGWSSTAGAD